MAVLPLAGMVPHIPSFAELPSTMQVAYREREVRAWASLAGFVGNAAASKALKRLAAQRRPAVRCVLLGNCDSFGMPSSHAQSMAFAWALHMCQAAPGRWRLQPRQVRLRDTAVAQGRLKDALPACMCCVLQAWRTRDTGAWAQLRLQCM